MESESKLPASEPTPRPHKALTVPELLASIFSWLSSADLASVARVCRFWNPVALDILWQMIPDLDCLLSTYYGNMEEFGKETQDMSDDQWNVFWAYCRRVRTLKSYGALDAPGLMDYIYHLKSQVDNRLPGPSLLPNLRHFSLRMWVDYPQPCQVLPIIPAELRVLKVGTVGGGRIRSLLKFLTAIPLSQLSVIHFYDRTVDWVDVSGSGTFLRPSGLATLLQQNHSTLVVLQLAPFHLTVSDLEQIGGFPKATTLGLSQKGKAKELKKFFNVITSSFPKLCSIEVILDHKIKEEVSVAVFEALEACRDLKIVFVRSRRWGKLTREDVARFGSWWPLMEGFYLAQSQYHPGQATNSLGILQDFAWVWSRTLRSITLPFDGSAPLPSLSAIDFKFEKLAEMNAGRSYISESSVENVAEFLRAISPGYLDIIALDYMGEDEDDYAPLWDAVRERVNAEVAVHSDDRRSVVEIYPSNVFVST